MRVTRWVETRATFVLEIVTRAVLSVIFLELENTPPFVRKIHRDELWLYKNPRTPSYVPNGLLWPLVFLVPTTVLLLYFLVRRDKAELGQGLLAFTLALALNGVITDIIKLLVGRPRPDFYYRCFPEGQPGHSVAGAGGEMGRDMEAVIGREGSRTQIGEGEEGGFGTISKQGVGLFEDIGMACTGEQVTINEGRKSFPSGHSSFSFCSLGFLSLWCCGKLGVFGPRRGQGWKLVVCLGPLLVALMVALSRTTDYHHHWQDVLVGSCLGLGIAYLCYRQYYPCLTSPYCHLSYLMLPPLLSQPATHINNSNSNSSNGSDTCPPLLLPRTQAFIDPESPMEEQVKWI